MTELYAANIRPLENEPFFRSRYDALPPSRKKKVDSLRFLQDRQRSVGAWMLLEHALLDRGIAPEDIRLTCGDQGKPALADHPGVHFSLSHSGQWVLCAVSDREVGCDVEQIRKAPLQVAKHCFSPSEYDAVCASPEPEITFFRLWTLKESFLKAVGKGLSLPLRSFSIRISRMGIRLEQSPFPGPALHFREFDLQEGYCCSCCGEDPDIRTLRIVELNPSGCPPVP